MSKILDKGQLIVPVVAYIITTLLLEVGHYVLV